MVSQNSPLYHYTSYKAHFNGQINIASLPNFSVITLGKEIAPHCASAKNAINLKNLSFSTRILLNHKKSLLMCRSVINETFYNKFRLYLTEIRLSGQILYRFWARMDKPDKQITLHLNLIAAHTEHFGQPKLFIISLYWL